MPKVLVVHTIFMFIYRLLQVVYTKFLNYFVGWWRWSKIFRTRKKKRRTTNTRPNYWGWSDLNPGSWRKDKTVRGMLYTEGEPLI